jgi:hypothetical protein
MADRRDIFAEELCDFVRLALPSFIIESASILILWPVA